jgi:sugar phosphate isomerase/epimerase
MRLGISGQALGEVKSLEEILLIMKSHNVDAIEIWPSNVPVTGGQVAYQDSRYEGRDIAKVKDLTNKYGIKVACVTMPGAFDKGLSEDIEAYASALKYAVEAAYELGAKIVNHYCYYLSLEENPELDHMMRYFGPAIKRAEELGIILALENEAHDAVRKPDGMLKLIESVNSSVFKTNFDATNYYHASEEGFPYAYDVLKEHIAYVHIKNGCIFNPKIHSEDSKGHEMSGTNTGKHIYYPTVANGAVNIDGLLKRLQLDGYEGFCTIEPHTIPRLVEAYYEEEITYLRSKKEACL